MTNTKYSLFTIQYGNGKILVLLFRLLALVLGLGFMQINNIFVQIFGIVILLFGIIGFFKNMFFQKMVFYDEFIEVQWNILGFNFVQSTTYINIEASKSNGIFGGSLSFISQNNKRDRFYTMFFFSIDLLPLNKEEIKDIKKILIEKKVIKGDEYVWID